MTCPNGSQCQIVLNLDGLDLLAQRTHGPKPDAGYQVIQTIQMNERTYEGQLKGSS